MTSLRQLGSDPLARLVAHALIAALIVGLAPIPAAASISRPALPELPLLREELEAAAKEPLVLVVLVVAEEALILTETAFGELLAHTGTDPQPYAFTGEPLDPNSGFQYHRARWMDPSVGRFASVDPWQGTLRAPTSLQKYLYADSSPAGNVDPTGFFTLASVFAAMSMMNTVYAISVPGLAEARGSRIRMVNLTQIPLRFGAFRTGMGAVAEMRVEPSGSKSRMIEELSLVDDTCRAAVEPCVVDSRTGKTFEEFPIGRGLSDPQMFGDRKFPAKKDTFYDPHLFVSTENVLARKQKTFCETTCRQVYRCPETRQVIGTFLIRFQLRPGELAIPGMPGLSQRMTFVQVQKGREITAP